MYRSPPAGPFICCVSVMASPRATYLQHKKQTNLSLCTEHSQYRTLNKRPKTCTWDTTSEESTRMRQFKFTSQLKTKRWFNSLGFSLLIKSATLNWLGRVFCPISALFHVRCPCCGHRMVYHNSSIWPKQTGIYDMKCKALMSGQAVGQLHVFGGVFGDWIMTFESWHQQPAFWSEKTFWHQTFVNPTQID